ncbi:MAG TPA: methyltransferase domain-containing protein [Candidatus Acidoferrum sp.]|nr:methyltransferase domain-containing protein [Candidatus Acidoferrum sp.]
MRPATNALACLLLMTFATAAISQDSAQDYHSLLARPGRPSEDAERDAASKPAEVLAFMGIKPGQTVLDFQAAGGYFSELLSYAVGPTGKVYAHNHSREGVLGPEVFERRYGNNRLPNVEQIFARHQDLHLPKASLDAVLMSMVYHDTYYYRDGLDWGPVDHAAFLAELRNELKPGGTITVIDHAAAPGSDPYKSAVATHRIDKSIVLRDFTAAGFTLVADSDLLRNPQDKPDVQIFEPSVYRETDRFMLRFRKP